MLGKAFRPQRQRPDRPLRPWPHPPSQRSVGAKEVAVVRVVWTIPLGAPSAQRSVSAYFALGASANNVLTFFLGSEAVRRYRSRKLRGGDLRIAR